MSIGLSPVTNHEEDQQHHGEDDRGSYLNEKFTSMVVTTSTGSPFSRVGS
jgi:hypothetical protein